MESINPNIFGKHQPELNPTGYRTKRLRRFFLALHPARIVRRRSVDRRHLAAHRTDVRAELAAMVNAVEQEAPENAADGGLPRFVASEQESSFAIPARVRHRADERTNVGHIRFVRGNDFVQRRGPRSCLPVDVTALRHTSKYPQLLGQLPRQVTCARGTFV